MRIGYALVGALKNIGHHKIGVCSVCARPTVFVCTDKNTVRNNMLCVFCHTLSRQRHVAQLVVARAVPGARNVKDIPIWGAPMVSPHRIVLSSTLSAHHVNVTLLLSHLLPSIVD